MIRSLLLAVLPLALAFGCANTHPPMPAAIPQSVPNLVAFWDFSEGPGQPRLSKGTSGAFPLAEATTPVQRIPSAPFGHAAVFDGSQYLSLPHAATGPLNLHGPNAQVTVVAWVLRHDDKTGFIAGMWNEGDRKRQYGLFTSLPYYGGRDQVCGHVSAAGGPSPGYPFSRDYSANASPVTPNTLHCIAFTYDGKEIRSYLDGVFEPRPTYTDNQHQTYSKNPYPYPDGLSNAGADFTVGAVRLGEKTPGRFGNFFNGAIAGLAVYSRALTPAELRRLHTQTSNQTANRSDAKR